MTRPGRSPRLGPVTSALKPEDVGILNRGPTAATSMQRLVDYMINIGARRCQTHFCWWTWQSNPTADEFTARCRLHTSPFVTQVRVVTVLAAVRYATTAQPNPYVNFTLKNLTTGDPGADIGGDFYYGHRDATNIGPENFNWFPLTFTVLPSTTYEFTLYQSDLLQVVGLSLYEVPPTALDLDTVLGGELADSSAFVERRGIYDADLAKVWTTARALFDDGGSVYFAWSQMQATGNPGGPGPCAITNSTYGLVNVFDLTITGYNTDARGFHVWPENHGTFNSDDVWVVIWVAVAWPSTSFAAAQVSFVISGVTIGTIDLQPYDAGASTDISGVALNCKWVGGAALTTTKVDILARNYDATQTVTIPAFGMYTKVPLDPRSISGLVVWLAADRITGLSDGDSVTTWSDSSGQANDAAQGTAGNKPTYQTGVICGKPIVRFDGADDYLTIADSASYKTADVTLFVVARNDDAGTSAQALVGYPHDGSSAGFRYGITLNPTGTDTVTIWGNNLSSPGALSYANIWRYWTLRSIDGVIYRDGAQNLIGSGTPTTTYPTAVGLYVGAESDLAANTFWDGDIAEVLVYSRELTLAEADKIELYLAEKYGLARGEDYLGPAGLFPYIVAKNTSTGIALTSHTVNLPAGIVAGQLLIAVFVNDGTATQTWPAGWTSLLDNTGGSGASDVRVGVRYRIADGTEASTITITTSAPEDSAHQSLAIVRHGSTAQAPELASAAGTSATPDPASLTPTGGAKDYLWIEGFGSDDDDETATYWSTSYTGINQVESDQSVDACMVSLAQLVLNATSEDPGAMALAASEEWRAFTIAVHPGREGLP